MEKNVSDFSEIVKKIESRQILLPDFQREFVWKDEEKQKKIVASVLSKMPIGSILLLKSKADEYSSKFIGCSKELDVKSSEIVEFLLDGQQRITVLTNVFSNVIHDECDKVTDLLSPSLKRRFFLRIPKWSKCRAENDWFGVANMSFKYQSDSDLPEFLSGDVFKFIECIQFLADDGKPYNPKVELSTKLDEFCLSYEAGYLVPLFLLIPSEKGNKQKTMLRYETIIESIARNICNEIQNHFISLENDEQKCTFIDEIFSDEQTRVEIKNDFSNFKTNIEDNARLWGKHLRDYIKSCVCSIYLNQIVVAESQRERAIDIYENLNLGGISLSTFDLIMAKVAKVSNKNYYKRLLENMEQNRYYEVKLLPDYIVGEFNKVSGKYNATSATRCFITEKREISNKYIDVYLNVLSLYCNNKDYESDVYKIDNIKRKDILGLSADEINDNCEKVCVALDRAMFFFQSRCGIRNINDINYTLMMTLVATIFMNDEWYNNKKTHDILEAWYWSSIFSGEYDKDQNAILIRHLNNMIKYLKGDISADWIRTIANDIMKCRNFSDKELLLMEKVEEDRMPKKVIKDFVCQYFLSKTYTDMFDNQITISVFYKDSDTLEAHHIIPLNDVAKVGESTKKLRNDSTHICNSPLNFCYITKESNKEISDESLEEYAKKMCNQAKSKLYISEYSSNESIAKIDRIKAILNTRFEYLSGNIASHVSSLLN